MKLSKKKVKLAIDGSGGIKSVIAERCGVTVPAITKFLNKHPDVNLVYLSELDKVTDLAESKLIKLIKSNDFRAIKFFLENKGKNRGYGQQNLDITSGGEPIQTIKLVEVVRDDDSNN